MKKLSVVLLTIISFNAAAMEDTAKQAVKYTAGVTGAAVSAYFASCLIKGKDETDVFLWSAKNTMTDKKVRNEFASKVKDTGLDIAKDTGKQLAIAGAAIAGGIAATQATKTAFLHILRAKNQS